MWRVGDDQYGPAISRPWSSAFCVGGHLLAVGYGRSGAAAHRCGERRREYGQRAAHKCRSSSGAWRCGVSQRSRSTGQASSARLTFLDDTNLSIGPSSRVVLDEFVYRGGSQAQNVAVSLTRGAFRFATGNSDKNAYQIKTTTATIGVRGTVLDIFSGPNETLVTLMDDGAATICTATRSRCSTLNIRGQTFVIDSAGVRLSNSPRTRFSFQQFCAGAAGLCGGRVSRKTRARERSRRSFRCSLRRSVAKKRSQAVTTAPAFRANRA